MGAAGVLLSDVVAWLHQLFGWHYGLGVWSDAARGGFVLGFVPAGGALLVSVIRRFTGNRFGLPVVALFLLIGVLSAGMVPWFAFTATVGGGSPQVSKVLFGGADNVLQFALYVVLLGVVPALSWLFVVFEARGAFRRGPRLPRTLFWVPFTLFLLGTFPLNAELSSAMWVGFLPASIIGTLLGRVLPAPSWSVIGRSKEDRRPPEPAAEEPGRPPSPVEPAPPVEPVRLADTPGPMPFPMRGDAPPPTKVAPLGMLAGQPNQAEAAALPIPAGGQHGTPGSRFTRIRKLGSGGFGAVWLATDTQLGRQVALKIAHAPDPETEERMYREARALAAVRHPNCVRVYDIVRDVDGLALVMEYIDGRSLADQIRAGGPVGDVLAARLWHTMAGALADAHGKGVLHRDVKPSNVVVDPGGAAHLIDFGIARRQGDSTLTASGTMLGTPDFLAPEVAKGRPATPSSDSWELAATVSYALTGRPPRGERETHIAALMAGANYEPCTELPRKSVHRQLLLAALAPEPARRPSLAVVQRELGGWLSRAGLSELGPVSPTTTVVRPEHGTQRAR